MKAKLHIDPVLHAHMREILHRKRASSIKNRKMTLTHLYVHALHRFFAEVEGHPEQPFSENRSVEVRLDTPESMIPSRDDVFEMVIRWYIRQPENYLGRTFAENLASRIAI